MKIFGELVKLYWNGQLNSIDDIKRLAEDIRDKYNFTQQDMPFIKDHIRIAMALIPEVIRNSRMSWILSEDRKP